MITAAEAVRSDLSLQDLIEQGLHYGHQTRRWNPKMRPYIFGERNGIHIIDLTKTLTALLEARRFIYDAVVRGRKVLFVGTKKQAQEPIREVANRLKMPYVVNRWLGGTLTNNQTIRKSVARMRELERLEADGTINTLPKKEVARIRHELQKMRFNFEGIADMEELPAALIVFDVLREDIAVREANRLKIPVVAVVDTNCDPDVVDYPIPGNDDAIRAIRLILDAFALTIQQAQNEYAKVAADEARRKAAEEAAEAEKIKAAEAERKAREREERKKREEIIAKLKAKKEASDGVAGQPPAPITPQTSPTADAPPSNEQEQTQAQ